MKMEGALFGKNKETTGGKKGQWEVEYDQRIMKLNIE
jgi:hypothetical protein